MALGVNDVLDSLRLDGVVEEPGGCRGVGVRELDRSPAPPNLFGAEARGKPLGRKVTTQVAPSQIKVRTAPCIIQESASVTQV